MRKNDTRVRRSMWDIAFVDCVDWDVWKSLTYFVRGKRTEAWFWHVAWSEKKSKRYYFFRLRIFMISKLSLNIKPPRLWPGLKWLFMPASVSFPLSTFCPHETVLVFVTSSRLVTMHHYLHIGAVKNNLKKGRLAEYFSNLCLLAIWSNFNSIYWNIYFNVR